MANDQQNQQNQQPGNQAGNLGDAQGGSQGGSQQRSEGLLPAGDKDDGRFDVAEEVNLDQQSDKMRHVGQAPDISAAEVRAVEDDPDAATGNALPDPGKQSDG
jgi:hypothetical protein